VQCQRRVVSTASRPPFVEVVPSPEWNSSGLRRLAVVLLTGRPLIRRAIVCFQIPDAMGTQRPGRPSFVVGTVVSFVPRCFCKTNPQPGLARLKANTLGFSGIGDEGSGPVVTSLPFSLNLPTAPASVITVASINGIAINANPFSFPDATINSATPVPVVINATNLPVNAAVTLYLLSDASPNQAIPVTLTGNNTTSTATVQVTFASGGTRGFVKATW
jgi:hypothetical protein